MDDKKEKQIQRPFNHVLEVQNGFIDVNEIFKRIDKKHLEESNGKKLSR